ncbi:MAG: dCTP deaminase [Thermoplasmata archaeon]|nr:dCTP deaminase [Thermoplasmata archaeon]
MVPIPDWQILRLLERGGLGIEPFCRENLTPNGYDLTVEKVFVERIGELEEAEVPPKGWFLVGTREYLRLSDHIIGLIWLRTSWMRRGLFGSFGVVDAGYEGNLTLGGFNASSEPVRIRRGDRFAQIVFFILGEPAEKPYSGRYKGSRGIVR